MRGYRPGRPSVVLGIVALAGGLLVAATAPASAAPSAGAAPSASVPGSTYTPMVPVRICDTRAAGPGVVANQCDVNGPNPVGPGAVRTIVATGIAGVPAAADAVVLHVTVTNTSATSFLTVWPAGTGQPTASNLNWTPGLTVPNLVQTTVGANGNVSIFNNQGTTDVVVDLDGYFQVGGGSRFAATTPTRVCDTRLGQPANQCNHQGAASGTLGNAQTKVINVVAGFGVPAGTAAVVLDVTATTTSAMGYLTVWPDGAAQPLASSLNWEPGQTISNRVITPVSATGNIDLFNARGTTDLVIDLSGYYNVTGSVFGYFPVIPGRICDTRPIGPGVVSNPCNSGGPGTMPAGAAFTLTGFNAGIYALVVNVTVTNTGSAGFLTVFPDSSATIPLAADITWSPGQTIANLAAVSLGGTAALAVFNGSGWSTDVILDVQGYYASAAIAAPAVAGRSVVMPTTATRSTSHHR
jgi:hypothetical protein